MAKIELDTPIDDIPLAFVDTETTGLNPLFGDRVCEIAVVRCRKGRIEETFQRLINPQRPMGAGAYRVHGIDDEMLRDAPPFAEIIAALMPMLDGAVFVGHNAPFDLGFLASELTLAQHPLPSLVALDTLKLARRNMTASSYSLENLCLTLGIFRDEAHRAMDDALATQQLFYRLSKRLRPRGVNTLGDYILAQGGPLRYRERQDVNVPPLIRDAMRQGQLLQIRYADARGTLSERLVRPLQVHSRGGQLYLVAHCYLRNDSRTFAVDRIQGMSAVADTMQE